MEDKDKKLIEQLEVDFHGLSSKGGWTKEDIEKMKDLQKLMYYIEVRCAMKEKQGYYPGSEYMDAYSTASYAMGQHRSPSTGRYVSYDDGMSGHWNPPIQNRWDGMSGRHYYDDERMSAINYLKRMHSNEQNPEMKMSLERAIGALEMR